MRPESYNPSEIEPRWQARWDELGLHKTNLDDDGRPPYYVLTMYDYPSGDLHIGHWFVKTPTGDEATGGLQRHRQRVAAGKQAVTREAVGRDVEDAHDVGLGTPCEDV